LILVHDLIFATHPVGNIIGCVVCSVIRVVLVWKLGAVARNSRLKHSPDSAIHFPLNLCITKLLLPNRFFVASLGCRDTLLAHRLLVPTSAFHADLTLPIDVGAAPFVFATLLTARQFRTLTLLILGL
jgi:hypothetical protein